MLHSWCFVLFQPPQKPRQEETEKEGEKEDAEIVVRNKQEMYSKPPPLPRKSFAPSTVSRKVNFLRLSSASAVGFHSPDKRSGRVDDTKGNICTNLYVSVHQN